MSDLDDQLWDALGVLGGYNSSVDNDIRAVLKSMRPGYIYNDDIAIATGLSRTHVELIQYLLCNAELADYGTSPRGCWLTPEGEKLADKQINDGNGAGVTK